MNASEQALLRFTVSLLKVFSLINFNRNRAWFTVQSFLLDIGQTSTFLNKDEDENQTEEVDQ